MYPCMNTVGLNLNETYLVYFIHLMHTSIDITNFFFAFTHNFVNNSLKNKRKNNEKCQHEKHVRTKI